MLRRILIVAALAALAGLPATRSPAQVLLARFVAAEDSAFEQPAVAEGPWKGVAPAMVVLLPQNVATPSRAKVAVENVEVRLVHNGAWLGVAVSWSDATRSESVGINEFPDAVAIGFPRGEVSQSSPFMGGHDTGMEILHWKALWQRDVEDGYRESTEAHPTLVADEYTGYRSEGLAESDPASAAPIAEVLASPEARQGLPAVAIGNPMTQLDRTSPVEQSFAEGFGTLSTQQQQDARGNAHYENGRWTVVITRPLDTGDPADIRFTEGLDTAINFAVWDGSDGDRGGRKSYSMFTPLRFEPRP